jgi:hypothetical protein
MDAVKVLRIAIVAQWLLYVLAAVASTFEETNLPEPLLTYLTAEYYKDVSISMWIGMAMLVAFAIASIGVFRLKSWGRNLYVALFSLGAVLFVFLAPTIETAIGGNLSYLASASCGLVIGLLYYSPASDHFDLTSKKTLKQPDDHTARTCDFPSVFRQELGAIATRRTAAVQSETNEIGTPGLIRDEILGAEAFKSTTNAYPLNLVGLALSGGGIRSAAFNLGVLQALSHNNLLSWCDYLSTVSGGGYRAIIKKCGNRK